MEALKTPETVVEGLVASREDGLGFEGKMFDFGGEKCAETGGIDPKGFPVSNPGGVGSSSLVDVPIKGISLFVELTGGVTGDVSHHLEDRVSLGNKSDSLVNGNRVCHQECRPDVGDFVWAMIKNQSWWPGVVCDPKEALKVPRLEDGLLVRCFGNASYVRCLPYQVKPFVAYFEQFSKQNNSKSFVGALEKAVAEFGYRIKTEFTCSCFSKTVAVDSKGDVGDLSATRFQPETFVDYIKDLARDVSKSTKIDCAVNKNFLSAFYRSLGRCQMGLRQLEPESVKIEDGNRVFDGGANKDVSFMIKDDIKVEKSEKHYETRERRKSRFLSYPYTEVNGVKGLVPGERVTEVNGGVELNNANVQPVKKPRKKWCRTVKKDDLVPNVCSLEVLSELQSAAQDCLFPIESMKFDSVERFITGFRKWAFKDFTKEIPIDRTAGQENGIEIGRTLDLNTNTNTSVDMGGKGTRGRPKKVRKKNDNKPLSPPVSGTNSNRGSLIIDFQNVGSRDLETQPMENKKTEVVADQVVRNDEVKEPVSDSIGQCTFLNFGDLPVNIRPPPCKLTPKRRKKTVASETAIHILPNVNGQINPFLIHNLPQVNNLDGFNQPNVFHLTNEVALTPPCSTGNQLAPPCSTGNQLAPPCSTGNQLAPPCSTGNQLAPPCSTGNQLAPPCSTGNPLAPPCSTGNQLAPPCFTGNQLTPPCSTANHNEPLGVTHEPKKRGRKRKAIHLQANPGSTVMPDLNETGAEKKRGKKGKPKETGVPCVDLSYNKVQPDNEHVTGTAFLLKFSSDHPLPSKHDLNSIFSKFGALNESETQVLDDSRSGQVVFLDSSSAGGAFWGLQNDHPFGPALVNYRIQHLSGAESESNVGFRTPIKNPFGSPKPLDTVSMGSQAITSSNMKNPSGLMKPLDTTVSIGTQAISSPNIKNPSGLMKPLDTTVSMGSQAISSSIVLPDLNGNSPENKPVKKSKRIEEIHLPSKDFTHGTGTAILLKFSPNHPLPSNQDLNSVFCKYGALNEFETQVSVQTLSGQVVFVNPSSAGEAVQNLEKIRPFGESLVSYRVHHLYNVEPAIGFKNPLSVPIGSKKQVPDLGAIKKNLEMMTMMMEKAGDTLSPEMRAKLESEIRGLMNKVSTMDGSCSSSL